MIGQILSNNNERCYNNFSPTFREVNTAFVECTSSSMDQYLHLLPAEILLYNIL
jgi:hypothetical protein